VLHSLGVKRQQGRYPPDDGPAAVAGVFALADGRRRARLPFGGFSQDRQHRLWMYRAEFGFRLRRQSPYRSTGTRRSFRTAIQCAQIGQLLRLNVATLP
jgi:hypothetical protein